MIYCENPELKAVMNNHTVFQRKMCRLGALLVAALSICAGAQRSLAQSEDGVKCAFLFNFAKFVEWPVAAFTDAATPITVGFIGADALADTFDQNVKGKNANGRDFVVKKLSGASGAEGCQIVYVADAGQAATVVSALKGKPVLIAGDAASLLESGGMIQFAKDGPKVVFDINLAPMTAAGLKVDPKLQKVARNVKGG